MVGLQAPLWPSSVVLAQSCETLLESELFQHVKIKEAPAQALIDPLIEEARQLKAFDDFKILSDMTPQRLNKAQRAAALAKASRIEASKGRTKAVRFLVEAFYKYKPELLSVNHTSLKSRYMVQNKKHKRTFAHIEWMWRVLIRRTPTQTSSSLLPLPYPFLIPGSRFQEGYYWDTFFAFPALLRTGREELVRGQIENFLFLIKNYGLIPNGSRQYYLSRSQPPLLSQMVRLYVNHKMEKGKLSRSDMRWLREEVFPLVKKDYEKFWMNSKTRYDRSTGLNHHFDSLDIPRPERHASDVEEALARTYRDVRAEAESGKDFTDAFEGLKTQYAGVMLNSILYQVEKDLSWMAELSGKTQEQKKYLQASKRRKERMYKYLWDSKSKVFRDYNFVTKHQAGAITADAFTPFYVGLVKEEHAAPMMEFLLDELEREGGLMASNIYSGKQWDAPYGWAPHHYFAIAGLKDYGFTEDAKRLAQKWVDTVDSVHEKTGKIIEKYDMIKKAVPKESGDKYITQEGFGWTNGVYVWALDVLGTRLSLRDATPQK